MKKYLLIGGAAALCSFGVMFFAQADNDDVARGDKQNNRHYHRGPVVATVDGAADVVSGAARGTANVIGKIFGGGRSSHNDSRGDRRSYRDDNKNYRD